jgi:GntR family transcriptional regulator / MocR family aminotransferase
MSPHKLHARDLLVSIDHSRPKYLARQLEDQLRGAIQEGRLVAGSDLPSSRVLAEDLGVSRGVVGRAFGQLAAEGYLEVKQGANPRVRRLPRLLRAPTPAPESGAEPRVRYDLRSHLPDVTNFPRQVWLRSTRNALADASSADLSYPDPQGLRSLRIEVAKYLGRARGVSADPDQIVITAGSTNAISLIGRVLRQQGVTRMAFENPSHLMLYEVARHAGLAPLPVAVDEHGIRPDCIEDVSCVLVSPAHQFPTGVALSSDRRSAVVNWARRTDGLILEDDYDAEFRYDRAPIGALQGLCPEHVAYIGSTGKTLAPALRVGWASVPSNLVEPLAEELRSSMVHASGMEQLVFADFLRRGEFDRHLRRQRTIYRARRDVVVGTLERRLPHLAISGIAAGLHVVLDMPSHELALCARERARASGIVVQTISQHALPGYTGPAGIIVGYGSIPEPTIPLAMKQLADAVDGALLEAEAA